MATKITKKNEQTDKDKELKRVANRVDNLSNIFDVIQRENDATFADLQNRVHKLESSPVSEKQAELEDKKFWRNCFGIFLVSVGIIFALQVVICIILSVLGLAS